MDRRSFLKSAAAGTGGVALAGPLAAFTARAAGAVPSTAAGYGPISPKPAVNDGVTYLALPDGFSYFAFGHVGSTMADGVATPAAHDGMAAFAQPDGKIRLVRNHEVRILPTPAISATGAYDPQAGGGCTILEFDPANPPTASTDVVPAWVAIAGTIVNCAGGVNGDSWLTCEETTASNGSVPHGYVFDVPSSTPLGTPATAVPIKGMGRFSHEATATDPATGTVYLTEDSGAAGFYRYVPTDTTNLLAGGTLEMLAVTGSPAYNTAVGQTVGDVMPASWVTIDQPDSLTPSTSVQGVAKGAATFRRLEGAWWSAYDAVVYFNSTDGGEAQAGQVWAYSPADSTLTLVYQSPGSTLLLKPDNLCVSPAGGVYLMEDPDRARQAFLRGLTPEGELYTLGANVREGVIPGSTTPASWDEFAGGTFSPDNRWMFVNIQTPGVTFAITGPFESGPPPVVPEAPTAALLGVAAAATAVGAAVVLRNRGAQPTTTLS